MDKDLAMLVGVGIFLSLIVLELVHTWRDGDMKSYDFRQSMANLANGVGEEATGLLFAAATLAVYALVWEHARFFTFDAKSPAHWGVALLVNDCCMYWLHRTQHRVNLLWAAHQVHHQSTVYNLTVALRQSWTGRLTGWVFVLPLALLGVPVKMLMATQGLIMLWGFLMHTRIPFSFGVFRFVFMTPAQHQVHHASNEEYLDKNYGQLLIVWDRLFGTYAAPQKDIEIRFGLTESYEGLDVIDSNFRVYRTLVAMSRKATSLAGVARVWFGAPETLENAPAAAVDANRGNLGVTDKATAFGLLVVACGLWFALVLLHKSLALAPVVGMMALVVVALRLLGGVLERGAPARVASAIRVEQLV